MSWRKIFPGNAPIKFINVEKTEERDRDSPSWFNFSELIVVINLVKDLITKNKFGKGESVKQSDIGIVTPYRKQVEKLRNRIHEISKEDPNIKELQIGTVEQFQGHENKIIIIKTVKSIKEEELKNDLNLKLASYKTISGWMWQYHVQSMHSSS